MIRKEVDVIFISHLLNSNEINTEDFYFGNLPNEFLSLILKINHTNIFYESQSKNVLVLPRLLSFNKEFHLLMSAFNEFIRLSISSLKYSGHKRKIYQKSAIEALAPETLINLRIDFLLRQILKKIKTKLLISTYEGHAWERVIFASTRNSKEFSIDCVGYQHAALFKMQHAIYRSLGQKYDPTYVLSAGDVGFHQMLRYSKLKSEVKGVLGSPRSLHRSKIKSSKCGKKILVIPEGILEDCIALFSFSIDCAKLDSSIEFIWRLHPLMSFKKIFSAFGSLSNFPDNIKLSDNNFEFDILNASFALHRGSTAVISAVAGGLVPIYLNISDNFSINPLFEVGAKCISVSTPKELINEISHGKLDPLVAEYCINFYKPFNSDVIRHLLNNRL